MHINGKKTEIRSIVEQIWDTKIEVNQAGLKVGHTKVDVANTRVEQEEELASLNKTLGEERVAVVRRKIYAIHEFDDVPE